MKRIVMTTLFIIGMVLIGGIGVSETYRTVEVNVATLNIRADNNTESKIIGLVHDGNALTVFDEIDGWYSVLVNENQMGYVKKEFCSAKNEYVDGSVSSQNVNMREKPTTSSSIVISNILEGTSLQILSKEDNWYKVICEDKTGYIRSDLAALELNNTPERNDVSKDNLISFSKNQLGKPYSWGKSGPDSFDCSGFVNYVFRNVYDKDLGHSSSAMSKLGSAVEKSNLVSGDLVFFSTGGGSNINHVGIYIGDGSFIHASSSNSNGKKVVISPINSGYYAGVYRTARRIDINN